MLETPKAMSWERCPTELAVYVLFRHPEDRSSRDDARIWKFIACGAPAKDFTVYMCIYLHLNVFTVEIDYIVHIRTAHVH